MFGALAFLAGVAAVMVLRKGIRLHLLHWLMFCFVLWGGVSYYWSIDQEHTLERLWTYLQLLIMVWLVYQWVDEAKALKSLLGAYVLGAYVSVFSTVVSYFGGEAAHWHRYSASGFNPNDIAIILAQGIPMAWYLFQAKWGGRLKWAFFIYPFLAPIAVALTGSRSGLIATLAALLFVLWTAPGLPIRTKLACLVAGVGATWTGISFVPVYSWGRLATTGTELFHGGWNYRLSIWEAGVRSFAKNPVLGVGAGAFRAAVEPFLGTGSASHNVYLAVLVEQGLVGFVLFALILAAAVQSSLQLPTLERRMWLVLLGTWGVSAFAHPWEWRKQTWILFALVVAHAAALVSKRKTEILCSDRGARLHKGSLPLQVPD